jgi:hypothetical protein
MLFRGPLNSGLPGVAQKLCNHLDERVFDTFGQQTLTASRLLNTTAAQADTTRRNGTK